MVQFDKEANQTRDYWVAENATLRAGRPDSSPRKERLFGMTNQTEPLPENPKYWLTQSSLTVHDSTYGGKRPAARLVGLDENKVKSPP